MSAATNVSELPKPEPINPRDLDKVADYLIEVIVHGAQAWVDRECDGRSAAGETLQWATMTLQQVEELRAEQQQNTDPPSRRRPVKRGPSCTDSPVWVASILRSF